MDSSFRLLKTELVNWNVAYKASMDSGFTCTYVDANEACFKVTRLRG